MIHENSYRGLHPLDKACLQIWQVRDNQFQADNVFFSFEDDSVTLEAGKLQCGHFRTNPHWFSDILNKNLDKLKNENSVSQFQDVMRPLLSYVDHLSKSPQIHVQTNFSSKYCQRSF